MSILPVKTTPMAVSSLTDCLREIQPMPRAARTPAANAPSDRLQPNRYAITKPGSVVCDSASPTKAMRLWTT
jgi:hypothetical protein